MNLIERIPAVRTSIFWEEIQTVGSYPCRFYCDDGNTYFVKHSLYGQKRRQVVNEFLGSLLADMIALNIPRYAIVEIDKNILTGDEIFSGGRPDGIGFGSRKLQGTATNLDMVPKCAVNKNNINFITRELLQIILFDIWTKNSDRTINNPNVLIEEFEGEFHLVAIDHAEIFYGLRHEEAKTEMDLPLSLEDTLIQHDLFGTAFDNFGVFFEKEVDDILNAILIITVDDLEKIYNLLPDSLKLKESEKCSISNFLITRAARVKSEFYCLKEEAGY